MIPNQAHKKKENDIEILDIIVLTTLFILAAGMQFIKPNDFNVSVDDIRYHFPSMKRSLPAIFNYMLILVVYPSFIFIASTLCFTTPIKPIKIFFSYGTATILAYIIALSLELFIGIPRPNTLHRCGNLTYESCSQKIGEASAKSQFLSFPSSEATVVSACGYFVTNFFDILWNDSSLIASIIKLFPIFYIFFNIAVLIVSAENSPTDVSFGTLIGIIVSKSIMDSSFFTPFRQ
ncbi:hypothetical protein TRFO_33763 [Tritrichomonas foetus]|uniref:Phosphatidic acid phosphatase type 2/haloperoxidase domain-containing protein n=1 Tax=Tritrichomonas foetus TaxID=1144522 RepID=A0A1J4JMS5_9EUKA|nr:hypothetical protein TRFO_33763 [Tritrichomonas foetus]|eukprot:OHS99735.1 hypothetical protein TRFO_33763 [Tritrichomonas foetus]